MRLKKMISLDAIEQSPTSTSSQGSAPEPHWDPPYDPHGHFGTCLSTSVLKSFLLLPPGVSFFHQPNLYPTEIPDYPYGWLPSLVAVSDLFVYSLIIHVSSFPQAFHWKHH